MGLNRGLERMTWMLEKLGNPQRHIYGIHVVGTNGKGSTVNDLQTIFSEAGYGVGTFISPYIIDFRERISINGRMISERDLVHLVQLAKPVVERLPLETDLEAATEFEVITLFNVSLFRGKCIRLIWLLLRQEWADSTTQPMFLRRKPLFVPPLDWTIEPFWERGLF